MRPNKIDGDEKTQIAGGRNDLAAARPCCMQVIKASVAAAVHNRNDQHTTGGWTRSLRSCVNATSALLGGGRFLYATTSWSAAGMFEVTSYYDASGLRITAKSPG
jgi:hypothetical protein